MTSVVKTINGTTFQLTTFGQSDHVNEIYHRIRKKELFTARGRGKKYDPGHPDERKEGNFPLALIANGYVVGTVRLDNLPSSAIKTAALRLVAIERKHQSKGYGRALIELVEMWAQNNGEFGALVLNSAQHAYLFYQGLGYTKCCWQDPAEHHFDNNTIPMAKIIPPRPRGL